MYIRLPFPTRTQAPTVSVGSSASPIAAPASAGLRRSIGALFVPISCTVALLTTSAGIADAGPATSSAQALNPRAQQPQSSAASTNGIVRLEITQVESPTFDGQS